jgi:hypothetical protein
MEEKLNNVNVIMIKDEVNKLMNAARSEDWELVDKEIVPGLKNNPDGNLLAIELLNYSNDSDPNVRDAVATGLMAANITDSGVIEKSITKMIEMSRDDEKFPAGRSVVFLTRYQDSEKYSDQIMEAIEGFKSSVENNGWREELLENIPNLEPVLNTI